MMIKKYIAMAAAALMLTGNAMAQEEGFRKNNWFVTGGVNTEAFMNTNGYVTATGKVGAGVWLNPWLGLKLEGVAGNTHLMEDSRGQIFGANLSYMTHLYGAKEYKTFNLNATVGVGFYHHKFGSILKSYTYMNVITGNLGIQAVYNISPKWSVYAEPGLMIQPKYYEPANKDKMALSGYLSVGVTYSFSKKFNNIQKKQKVKRLSDAEISLMNEQLNAMRAELKEVKTGLAGAKVVDETKRVILEPMKTMPSVSVHFDAMGSILSAGEASKLEDIGFWMQDRPNSITIVPFADSMADKALEEEVKKERAQAIIKVLTEQYGIDSKRIKVTSAEEMGYVNKTASEAMVVFMAE